jgi:hypothetical protein
MEAATAGFIGHMNLVEYFCKELRMQGPLDLRNLSSQDVRALNPVCLRIGRLVEAHQCPLSRGVAVGTGYTRVRGIGRAWQNGRSPTQTRAILTNHCLGGCRFAS